MHTTNCRQRSSCYKSGRFQLVQSYSCTPLLWYVSNPTVSILETFLSSRLLVLSTWRVTEFQEENCMGCVLRAKEIEKEIERGGGECRIDLLSRAKECTHFQFTNSN